MESTSLPDNMITIYCITFWPPGNENNADSHRHAYFMTEYEIHLVFGHVLRYKDISKLTEMKVLVTSVECTLAMNASKILTTNASKILRESYSLCNAATT